MLKKALIAVAAVVVIVAGAAIFLVSNLDSLVKTAIEEVGSKVAGVPVRVSSVKIALSEGRGTIKGLTVGNPAGFKTANAFSLGEISVSIDTGSVTANPVVIRDITVLAPEVTYEMAGTSSNIEAIQRNIQSFTANDKASAKSDGPAKSSSSEPDKKLTIDQLALKGGKLNLATPLPGGKASAQLPDIRLANIGKGSGASPAQVASQVLDAVARTAVKTAANLYVGTNIDSAVSGAASKGGLDQVKGLLGR